MSTSAITTLSTRARQESTSPTPDAQPLFDQFNDQQAKYRKTLGQTVELAVQMPQTAYTLTQVGTVADVDLFRRQHPFLRNKGTFSQYCAVGSVAGRLLTLEVTVKGKTVRVKDYLPPYWTHAYEVRTLTDEQFASLIEQRILRPEIARPRLRAAVSNFQARRARSSSSSRGGSDYQPTYKYFIQINADGRLTTQRRKELERIADEHVRPLGYGVAQIKPEREKAPDWMNAISAEVDRLSSEALDHTQWLAAVTSWHLAHLPMEWTTRMKDLYQPVLQKNVVRAVKELLRNELVRQGRGPSPAEEVFTGQVDEGLFAAVTAASVNRLLQADKARLQTEPSTGMSLLSHAVNTGVSEATIAEEVQYVHELARCREFLARLGRR